MTAGRSPVRRRCPTSLDPAPSAGPSGRGPGGRRRWKTAAQGPAPARGGNRRRWFARSAPADGGRAGDVEAATPSIPRCPSKSGRSRPRNGLPAWMPIRVTRVHGGDDVTDGRPGQPPASAWASLPARSRSPFMTVAMSPHSRKYDRVDPPTPLCDFPQFSEGLPGLAGPECGSRTAS